jgi:short-subunit dehydrogenase
MAVYYASKGFVVSFSEAIAHELRGTGVTVTCHCPGATATEFASEAGIADSNLFKAAVADAASVARHGYKAMQSGRVLKVHGPLNWLAMESVRLAPRAAMRPLVAWVNSKS